MRLGFFSSTRADSGLLSPVVAGLKDSHDCVVLLAGSTEPDGPQAQALFDYKDLTGVNFVYVGSPWGKDTEVQFIKSLGLDVGTYAEELSGLELDLMFILGDRAESFLMAFVCNLLGVPIAHFQGGDITLGSTDQFHRDAITAMSTVHFPTSEASERRVRSIALSGSNVHKISPLVTLRLANATLGDKASLEREFEIKFGKRTILYCCHPSKFDDPPTHRWAELALGVLSQMSVTVILTGANRDPNSGILDAIAKDYARQFQDRFFFVNNFGGDAYLKLLGSCDLVIGNSSSFALEAPLLGVPAILLGERQKGRENSNYVLPHPTSESIRDALDWALDNGVKSPPDYCQPTLLSVVRNAIENQQKTMGRF